MVVTPLYGHTSQDTAYLIGDYPYGFSLRCKKRCWLELKPNKGFRFCYQTTNPKKGNIWNKAVESTYARLAACMFLDENGHVQWIGLNEYSEAKVFSDFFESFPGVEFPTDRKQMLRDWIDGKQAMARVTIAGRPTFSFRGEDGPPPFEEKIIKAKEQLVLWEKANVSMTSAFCKF
jgi:hypothetical protein